jgi:hypothetical protein
MDSQAVNVIIVRAKEGLSVAMFFIYNANSGNMPNQFFTIMAISQIVAHISTSVAVNIVQL